MKVLIVDEIHPILMEMMNKKGFSCDYLPHIRIKEVLTLLPDYEGIVIRSKYKLTKDIITVAKNLKFIARLGSGLDNIDVNYAENQGIICLNSPEGNRNAVAEHALGMLLSLLNNICPSNQEVKKGIWERKKNRGIELDGKIIGIIGYGNTGSAFVKKLSGFDVKLLVYDKYKKKFGNNRIHEVQIADIFEQTDILSLHIPLTDETYYMIDNAFFARFVKPIYIINTSRGKIIKTVDLVNGLKSGKILGAMLDVLEYEHSDLEKIDVNEQNNFTYLKKQRNVLLTPHIAGWTHESYRNLSVVLAQKIVDTFSAR